MNFALRFSVLLGLLAGSSGVFGQTGILDITFGVGGAVFTDIASGGDYGNAVALQPDGKIIVAGYANIGFHIHITVVRYEANGPLDTTFSADGIVVAAIDTTNDLATSVALQPDGKILVAGVSYSDSSSVIAVLRFTSNGSLDTTFDSDGIVLTDIGPGGETGNAIVIQPDGGILVAGGSYNGSDVDFAVVRYLQDGSLDDSFGVEGVVTTDLSSGSDWASAMVLQTDGKILVAGNKSGPNFNFAVARYFQDGSLDVDFGSGGITAVSFTSGSERCFAMALQLDGKILLAGGTDLGQGIDSHSDFGIVRLNANGSLDYTFDSDGKLTTDFDSQYDAAHAIVLQSDGKIIAVGNAFFEFALARYWPLDGSLDTTFGSGGIVTTTVGEMYSDYAYAATIQPDGKIIVAGSAYNGNGAEITVARYLNDLNIGIAEFHPGMGSSFIFPNPVSGHAAFAYDLIGEHHLSLQVVDGVGKMVRSFFTGELRAPGHHIEELDLSGLAVGQYNLVLRNDEGAVSVKVVKQ